MKIPMNKMKRPLFLAFVALITIAAMFFYVNTYIYNFFAATPKIAVTVTPSAAVVPPTQEFSVGVRLANQNIDATNLYLIYDSTKVQYYKEYKQNTLPGEGITQLPQGYFTNPVVEEILPLDNQKKQLHVVLVALGGTRQSSVQVNFKFKALTNVGDAAFSIGSNSTVAGVDSSNVASYFDKDPAVATNKVTIGINNTTITLAPTVQTSIPPSPTVPTTNPTISISPIITSIVTVSPGVTITTGPSITGTPISPTIITSISPGITTTLTPTVTPIPEVTNNIPQAIAADVHMKIRFQGVTNPKPQYATQIVEVGLSSYPSATQKVQFTHTGNGIWEGTFKFNRVYVGNEENPNFGPFYTLFVKGPKHIRKKICDINPTESVPGTYNCKYGNVAFHSGVNELDFSNIILLAGDLPIQDGVVNSLDFAFIRQNFGSTDAEVLTRGDLNFDGIVQTDDHTLIKNALDFKYDDE